MTKVIVIEVTYTDEDNIYWPDKVFFARRVNFYHPPALKENCLIITDPDHNQTLIPLSRLTNFYIRPTKEGGKW